ncbi:MAG: PaaI family thioesterase [bacterium]
MKPQSPNFASRVRESFALQKVMQTIGASLGKIAPGEVEIILPFRDDLTQQNGFLHAGIVTTILDSACGYAAYTLMPEDANVLSVEFKINLCAPAKGDTMIARAKVKKPGRTLTVCEGDVCAVQDGAEKLVATMQATMMMVLDRPDL